jgi:hypothetical protein
MRAGSTAPQLEPDPDRPSLYQALRAAGIPLDSHESDLYAKVTPASTAILRQYGQKQRVFLSQIDRCWWYDLPFRNEAWWGRRVGR